MDLTSIIVSPLSSPMARKATSNTCIKVSSKTRFENRPKKADFVAGLSKLLDKHWSLTKVAF